MSGIFDKTEGLVIVEKWKEKLEFFFSSLLNLKGVGEKVFDGFCRLLPNSRYKDLLFHFPTSVVDRSYMPTLMTVTPGRIATLVVEVMKHMPAPYRSGGKKVPYKILCSDGLGTITILFFNAGQYLEKMFPVGRRVCISGKVELGTNGRDLFMCHPDFVVPETEAFRVAGLEPVYDLVSGISNKMVRNVVNQIVEKMPALPEWQAGEKAKIGFVDAVRMLHNPVKDEHRMMDAKIRFCYDEILANQLALALSRESFKVKTNGAKIQMDGSLTGPFLRAFGFELTKAQARVWGEIKADLLSDSRMLRLLQGDVGSGKTIIAMMSLEAAVEAGGQGAFMAPTEILAVQHFETFSKLLKNSGLEEKVRIMLLTGRDKGKVKSEKLAQIAAGMVDIVIGTHALFQENVVFKNLMIAVIDEQHKFGVNQRIMLSEKGSGVNCNILAMTATPIPRTLAMASFGDMDLSVIDELPPNRCRVETVVLDMGQIDKLVSTIKVRISEGSIRKLYWVCPLVDESEKLEDVSAATERAESLRAVFGRQVGLVHGKMKPEEKEKIMDDFANPNGVVKILVATTVIEVGVNVPEATLMIIEHSERFGLSSLHQLRGRIGRGSDKSTCILLHTPKLTEVAKERLGIMRATTDGFKIAEKDLKLRGAGDILGVRQSGMMDFKLADIEADYDLFVEAAMDVRKIMAVDKPQNTERWQALQCLLYLFEYNKKAATING